MEILKNLSEQELDVLKHVFESNKKRALSRREFRRALRAASKGKVLPFPITKSYLNLLFSNVDAAGDEQITWVDFSMYVVEQSNNAGSEITLPYSEAATASLRTPHPSSSSDDDLEPISRAVSVTSIAMEDRSAGRNLVDGAGATRRYHVDALSVNPMGLRLTGMQVIPRSTRIVSVTENLKQQHTVSIHEDADGFPVIAVLPRRIEPFLCWEHVPHTGGVSNSYSVVSSYNGGLLQLYHLPDDAVKEASKAVLTPVKTLHTSDTQTSLRWSPDFKRLFMGNRIGVVSVWDVDTDTVASQERLHNLSITRCCVRRSMLYTGSADRFDSVKATDLEKSVVLYSFSDHIVDGVLLMDVDDEYIITTGCETKIVLRSVQAPNASFTNLHDPVTPHQGRVSSFHRIPSTPLIVSGDVRGNVKIWDLRMNNCVQTFPPSLLGYVKKPAPPKAPSAFMTNVSAEEANDSAMVTSICPLPKLGLINIGTASHRFTLTALDAAFPDRVDDETACRFIGSPNPNQLITVHATSFKLWDVTCGHLIYCSPSKSVNGDITAFTLVEPLKRQLLCGTVLGDLRGFTVSLGKRVFNFYHTLHSSHAVPKEKPIISLDTIPHFRDQPFPYVIITFATVVVMVPVVPAARPESLVVLHVVNELLDDHTHCIQETHLVERQFFVATSNNRVHLVDLHFNTVTASFALPTSSLDNIAAGISTEGALSLEGSVATKHRGQTVQSFFFAADNNGTVMCGKGVHLHNIEDMKFNVEGDQTRQILGHWSTDDSQSWRWAKKQRHHQQKMRRRASARGLDAVEKRDSFIPVVAENACSAITHMFYFGIFCVLVTGDERGGIKLWDMNGVLLSGGRGGGQENSTTTPESSPPLSRQHTFSTEPDRYSPVLISEWNVHSQGFTCLSGIDHPHLLLPVVVTCTPDHFCVLWSADGYALGSFAVGRYIDDTSGGRRFGLMPYLFKKKSEFLGEKWSKFLDYFKALRSTPPLSYEDDDHDGHSAFGKSAHSGAPSRASTCGSQALEDGAGDGEAAVELAATAVPTAGAEDSLDRVFVTEPEMKMPTTGVPWAFHRAQQQAVHHHRTRSGSSEAGPDEKPFSDFTSGGPFSSGVFSQNSIHSSHKSTESDKPKEGLVKPQFALKVRRGKPFRLSRTGVAGTFLPPVSARQSFSPRYLGGRQRQKLESGNGVLEMRVRQQSILTAPGMLPPGLPVATPSISSKRRRQQQQQQPSLVEVSSRMIKDEVDVSVNVRGKVAVGGARDVGPREGRHLKELLPKL